MRKAPDAYGDALAILVVREEGARLERVLRAVAGGRRKPARLAVAVVGGDPRGVRAVVDTADASASVVDAGGAQNLASAVARVLSEDRGSEPWVWILHEDSAPEDGCLDALMRTGEASAKIGVVGPKQVDWDDPKRLLEVGIRATRTARRVPEIGEDERDQGQYDARSDVLGLGTAGMLVRREAAEAVGWLDPALGPFGDGLEFSRRMWLGGWRVVVDPQARIAHARESLGTDEQTSFGRRRAAQAYNGVLAAGRAVFPLLFVAYLIAGPLRAFARLLAKEPRLAAEEVEASGRLLSMTGAVRAGRARTAGARKVPDSVLRSLEDRSVDVRRGRRDLRRAKVEAIELASDPGPLVKAELRRWRATTRKCGAIALATGVVAAVVANLPVLGRTLTGGSLLPDSWGAGDLLGSAPRAWLASGDGFAAPVDALWVLLAPLVAATGSNLGAVATGLVVASVPLAALTGFLGARALTNSPQIRAAAAIGWALAPPLLGAVSQGHVAGVVWHVLAPLAFLSLTVAWKGASVPALGTAAIVLAYMSAAAPVTFVFAVAASLAGFASRKGRRKRWLWLPVPALAALMPTIRAALSAPEPWRLVAATPGRPGRAAPSGLGVLGFSPRSTVETLSAGPLGVASVVLPMLLVLLAAACLLRSRNVARIRTGWAMLGFGWAWAGFSAAVTTGYEVVGAGVQQTRGWAGIGLSMAFLGLFVVLVSAGDGLRTDLRKRSFGARHVSLFAVTGAACVAPLVLGGMWSVDSLEGRDNPFASRQLAVAGDGAIPALAAADQASPGRGRVLVLLPVEGGVQARLWRGAGDQLHETSTVRALSRRTQDAADVDLASAVASLAGNSVDFAEKVGEHAVSVVLIPVRRDRADTVTRNLIFQLNGVEGLEYVTSNASGTFWRVRPKDGAISRLRTVASGKEEPLRSDAISARTRVPRSSQQRTLVLAERADSGWRASANGHELRPIERGWRQAWELPGAAGDVVVEFGSSGARRAVWVQALVAGAALVVAIPRRRRKLVGR